MAVLSAHSKTGVAHVDYHNCMWEAVCRTLVRVRDTAEQNTHASTPSRTGVSASEMPTSVLAVMKALLLVELVCEIILVDAHEYSAAVRRRSPRRPAAGGLRQHFIHRRDSFLAATTSLAPLPVQCVHQRSVVPGRSVGLLDNLWSALFLPCASTSDHVFITYPSSPPLRHLR